MHAKTSKKRFAITAIAAAGGSGIGWVYATVITSCGGTCLVGAHPYIVMAGLGAVAGYSALVATKR